MSSSIFLQSFNCSLSDIFSARTKVTALKWNKVTCSSAANAPKKNVVIIGGGWAGFAASHQIAKSGANVVLLDASSNIGGLSGGFRTSAGRPVEAGIKGFWYN